MSQLSDDFVAAEPAPLADEIGAMLVTLTDGFDHPEVWRRLAEIGAGKDSDDLAELMAGSITVVPAKFARPLQIMRAMTIAVYGDRAEGQRELKALEAQHAMCPQTAGASFFVARLGDPDRTADLSARFCAAPFRNFETLIDGTVAPCCSIWTKQRYGQLSEQTFAEIWNSDEAVEMRTSILDGSFRHCNKQRCTFIMEDALPLRDEVADPTMRRIIDGNHTVLDSNPTWLYFAHDVTCNLACPSCRGGMLGADEVQKARFARIEEDVFMPLLAAGGDLEVSMTGQGDPWASQHYRSVLRYIADNDLDITFNLHTNALLMTETRWNQYLGLEKYRPLVNVSIDACKPWSYEVVRRPGKWEMLEPNLHFIADKRRAGVFRQFCLNATIQLDNFHEMASMIDLAEQLEVDEVRYYMMQNTGGHLALTFEAKNIADPKHKLHLAFLETLRDPKLTNPRVHLYDVANWRTISLATELPSDRLGPVFTLEDLCGAIAAAVEEGNLVALAALCAAGRVRWPHVLNLLRTDALALSYLGYPILADYRLREADEIEAALAIV